MLDDLAARCTFPRQSPVACAVSGGADSCALLVLARHVGLEVTAYHVDHGIRVGSASEADLVETVAARFGAAFKAVSVDVPAGPNLEARAREARYRVLPADVLTGHTADDQAETVLLNLVRGGGLDGSAGMPPTRKPIVGLRRHETEAVCAELGIAPVVDPTNSDPTHRRNRMRHEVLPLLDDIAQRDVVPLLARAAGLARVDVEFLDELAAAVDPTDVAALRATPLAIRRRVVRQWLRRAHPPDNATVERVLSVVDGEHRSTEIGAGRTVRRRAGRLILDDGTAS